MGDREELTGNDRNQQEPGRQQSTGAVRNREEPGGTGRNQDEP